MQDAISHLTIDSDCRSDGSRARIRQFPCTNVQSMAVKQRRLEPIAGRGPTLPDCVARAVAANDRVKYYLALLQAAQAQASSPQHPAPNLRALRESSGVPDTALDRVVEESSSRGNGTTYIPAACAILDALFDGLGYVAAAAARAGARGSGIREGSARFRRRLDTR